jgi:NAD+ synthase/NAD+ synthase (glutamine-hydrolysing)
VKAALVQINPLVGDLEGNASLIVTGAREACAHGADLAVFPELALLGYPPQDLLDEPEFIARCLQATGALVSRLGDEAPGISVVFGTVRRRNSRHGKSIGNSVVLCRDGELVAQRDKTLLPTYDVFDENRWFEEAEDNGPIEHLGTTLGLTICEDMWNDELFWGRRLYDRDPVAELAAAGARIIVNASASPYRRGKAGQREDMMAAAARRHGIPVLFCNQVGGNDELIFDGGSSVMSAEGRVLCRAPRFESAITMADLEDGRGEPAPLELDRDEIGNLRKALVLGIRDYVGKCGFRSIVLGLSGGIDSAVVAALATEALGPENVEGVLMPSRFSSQGSIDDSLALAGSFGFRTRSLPIEAAHAAFLEMLAESFEGLEPGVAEENLQARVRGTLLMALSNKFGSLVLSTGNKSELAVGYCTLYGDMNGGLAVLGDCYKGWVRDIARSYNRDGERFPVSIIDKPPSAELRPDQADTDSLPPYHLLDAILEAYIENQASVGDVVATGVDEALARRVRGLLDRNEYKRRQAPPVLRVTSKAFGPGRRLPLARA